MRRPQMSTGAWLFSGLVAAALITPAGVYAAVNSRVAIGNPGNTVTATVTNQHQLMTTTVAPNQIVRAAKNSNSAGCVAVYTPPTNKAIVVTSVVYSYGTGLEGNEQYGALLDQCGINGTYYDMFDAVHKYDTIQHTFPLGMPMPSVAMSNSGGYLTIYLYGYLIQKTELPPAGAAQVGQGIKGSRRGH